MKHDWIGVRQAAFGGVGHHSCDVAFTFPVCGLHDTRYPYRFIIA